MKDSEIDLIDLQPGEQAEFGEWVILGLPGGFIFSRGYFYDETCSLDSVFVPFDRKRDYAMMVKKIGRGK